MPGHHRGGKPPIRSKSQWRFLFATHKTFAHRWAHMTPGGKKVRYQRLPYRKGGPTARSAR